METDDRIVISGISGRLPESSNVEEFSEHLFSGVDVITEDGRRWTPGLFGVFPRSGKLKTLSEFDASFFGVHTKQAHVMDPQIRMLMETSYESIVDAGINPQNIRGSRTGVFVGICENESCDYWCAEAERVNGYGLIGCTRSMFSNRISYSLDLRGPSYSIACTCSSGMIALQQAFNAIQTGQCDAAIVAGTNLCMNAVRSLEYQKINRLSPSGFCKVFDESCDGYVQSEAIVTIFIQRSSNAKRSYATILNARTNADGYKIEGLLFPSGEMQKKLIHEVFSEAGVQPGEVSYVEVHGTGIKEADREEANAIAEVFCANRSSPLLVGCVKSNVGHTESASGLTALTKVLLSMEKETLPPNLHFRTPIPGVPAFIDGRLKVVDKLTSWNRGLAAINSYGFSGSNVHVLLERNNKCKDTNNVENVTRIVTFSGRTEQGVYRSLEKIEKMPVDDEFINLLHCVHRTNVPGHNYRGFALLGAAAATREVSEVINGEKRPVWFIFSGMGSQWPEMAKDMMQLPVFRHSIQKCVEALKPEGVNLYDIVVNGTEETFNHIVNPFIGITAVQIALVDVLRSLGITADGLIGHSTGEIACAYADGSMTLEQTILCAYFRGKSVLDTKLPAGAMAAVGLSLEEAKALTPPEIDIACHNSSDNVTLSGPADDVRKFVQSLQSRGIFAKEVNCAGLSFHSRYINDVVPLLTKYLEKVIPHPRKRSAIWISSSVAESMWNTPLAQCASTAYNVNNMKNPVLFQEATAHIPDNAVVIEVGAHGLLQAILKRSLPPNCTNISLMKRHHANNVEFLFSSFGKMYNAGLQPDLAQFHPKVSYPVSRGTPMIAPLVDWDHSEEWTVASFDQDNTSWMGECVVEIDLRKDENKFLVGHKIDGCIMFPAAGYLELVWKTLATMRGEQFENLPVVFENVHFHRAVVMSEGDVVSFEVKIFHGSGAFELCTRGSLVVYGRIYTPENIDKEMLDPYFPPEDCASDGYLPLTSADVYEDLCLRGYEYEGTFKGILAADNMCLSGELTWRNNWVTFMDTMLQFSFLQRNTQELLLPKRIQKLIINPSMQKVLADNIPMSVQLHRSIGITKAGGVEIHGLKASVLPRRNPDDDQPKLEKYCFVPYISDGQTELTSPAENDYALNVLLQIVLENINKTLNINLVEIANKIQPSQALYQRVISIFEQEPMMKVQSVVVCHNPEEYSKYGPVQDTTFVRPDFENEAFNDKDIHLTIVSDTQRNSLEFLRNITRNISCGNFILLKDSESIDECKAKETGLEIVSVQKEGQHAYTLLRKSIELKSPIVVYMTERNFIWMERLKRGLKQADNDDCRVILLCQRETFSGILGLVNCIRQEPGGHNLRCMFLHDVKSPIFSLTNAIYERQFKKDLVINIFRKGQWGCYRHISLANSEKTTFTEVEHAYLDTLVGGDVSSLRWVESPLSQRCQQASLGGKLCTVYYAPLNYDDVMLATGKSLADACAPGLRSQDRSLGMEFSGRDAAGRRVMGLVPAHGLATTVVADPGFLWHVPDKWSLEEAATVSAAYATSYYALVVRGRMRQGETLLVHAGSGGVGQASISIALNMGVTVFTTVGSPEKRAFLKQRFPQLTDRNIFDSRGTSFEKYVMNQTAGRGVDLVLNSLSEDKLQASVRCLALHSRFLEIGKLDITSNNPLGMSVFLRNTSFHGIDFSTLFHLERHEKRDVVRLMSEGIKSGVVQPLPKTVFRYCDGEKAFRFAATGKHIGKVILKIRSEEPEKVTLPSLKLVSAISRTYMNPQKVYVIVGGLGGIGLELANWLVLRGATKIVLTSSSGVRTGYQSLCIRWWKEIGVTVSVLTVNCSVEKETVTLLNEAKKVGNIGGIFNLAAIVKDMLFENFTEEDVSVVYQAKANTTKNLDTMSRILCRKLDYFVVFSSVACGRGKPGRSNYGLANSAAERICEERQSVGLPALAVQWGPVGDAGFAEDIISDETSFTGALPRRISSCLNTLDIFLRQSSPVVSYLALAKKRETLGLSEASDAFAKTEDIKNGEELTMPPTEVMVKLPSQAAEGARQPPLFLVHPIEGVTTCLEPLAAELPLPVWGLQCTAEAPLTSIQHLAAFYLQHVKKVHQSGHYILGGSSFGATVAFEMALQLEKMGEQVSLLLLDSSPSWLPTYVDSVRPAGETPGSNADENAALAYFVSEYLDLDIDEVRNKFSTCSPRVKRSTLLAKLLAARSSCPSEQLVAAADSLYKRIMAALTYKPKEKFKGSVTLFRAQNHDTNVNHERYLSKVCNSRVEVYTLDGNHVNLLQDGCIKKVASVISLNHSFQDTSCSTCQRM